MFNFWPFNIGRKKREAEQAALDANIALACAQVKADAEKRAAAHHETVRQYTQRFAAPAAKRWVYQDPRKVP